jgi:hypothetical protein
MFSSTCVRVRAPFIPDVYKELKLAYNDDAGDELTALVELPPKKPVIVFVRPWTSNNA